MMERLTSGGFVPAIGHALALIPPSILGRMHFQIFTGTDPLWAGLHAFEAATYGRSYRSMEHVVYPYHQTSLPLDRRVTTLVVPVPRPPRRIVHELGHILDEATGFQHVAEPVSAYARTKRAEAFAEAFTAWLLPGYSAIRVDDATRALLAGLAE